MVMTMRNSRTFIASVVALGTLTAHPSRVSAQTPATVNVTVDATGAVSPLKRIWAFHGYDEVNYTTTAPGQALLKTLGTIDTTPPHIRTHFLLNTGNGMPTTFKWGSTNVYTADANGNAVYDWTLMDGIMDTITSVGTLPFVEIGFMPHDLSVHPDPYQNSGVYNLDGGCFYPPKDYTKWGALISAWATHSVARYSGAGPWQWELWNEPDIGYWNVTGTLSKEQEYDKLFDFTEASLHQVLPTAPLGGPATASPGAFLTQFLQHCATGTNAVSGATGTQLDMVTFHAKGGVAIVGGHVEMNLGNQLVLHRNGFNVVAGFPQFKQTPIVVSEADPDGCAACPVSTNPQDAYRNSTAYGAYEVAMMKRTLELEASLGVNVRGLLTWAFLFNNQPYFAGYRTLSTNDIHLPVLNAFKLLGSLSGDRLQSVTSSGALTLASILANSVRQQADVDAMATLNGLEVQVLVWNYHDDLVTTAATPVHLSVQVPAAFGPTAMVTHMRVDDTHGDAYTVWGSQGSPAAPSAAQLTQLQQAMEPAPLQPAQTVGVAGNTVTLDFDLPRFGISLVTLAPVGASDASTGGSSSGAGSSDAAAAVDGTSSGDAASSSTGSSSGGGSGMSADGASPSPGGSSGTGSGSVSGSGSGSGGIASSQRPSAGCGCRVATTRRSTWIPEAIVLLLGVGLPAVVAYRRRRGKRHSGS
jgi:xylan 1,4-beta-xylosidase